MNATDDLSEPLGEGPIDTLTAIKRGAVLNILGAADEVLATKQLAERQTKALNAVRDMHSPCDICKSPCCIVCFERVPCATVRAIDEAGA